MGQQDILHILERVERGELSSRDAMLRLKMEPFENLDFAKLDHHRALRQGIPEVIYGAGKTPEQISAIVTAMVKKDVSTVIITRMSPDAAELIGNEHVLRYDNISRIGTIGEIPEPDGFGDILIATGGTSDMPVAEEAALTAQALGNKVVRLYDVGVAGLHRLLAHLDIIMSARAIIAIAGMEGALTSVIGGLADCPIIGVPTSVGYGASMKGVTALLSMLNSCACGVSVVNIDNGFGAGYLASMINHMEGRK